MIDALNNVNMYQPKKITIETRKYEAIDPDAHAPYQGTKMVVSEEKPDGESIVLAQYPLMGSSNQELEKVAKYIASAYAQEAYQPTEEAKNYVPVPGSSDWG